MSCHVTLAKGGYYQKVTNASQDVKKREHLHTVDESVSRDIL
jgi:hypothetical protein